MRILIALTLTLAPSVATADVCLDEFRAFHAAHMDRFARPPHRMELVARNPDDTLIRKLQMLVESPLDAVSTVEGSGRATLIRDRDMWSGPGLDGPWTKTDTQLPEGREGPIARGHQQRNANMTDVTCQGTVTRDGAEYLSYSWTSRTDTDEGGRYFGATNTGFFDPETKLPVIVVQTAMVSSFAPEPSPQIHTSTFTYDPSIRLPIP